MSVSVYNNTQCKYNLDKLSKVVYLINEDALRDIHIDDGTAYVDGIVEEPLSFEVYSISLSDTDNLDGRYKFTHTLKFSAHGYYNFNDLSGKYYAIVKTLDEEYWLVNPLFPCKVTYTYTLDGSGNHTDFTLSTVSNHPTLKIEGIEHATPHSCNKYDYCILKSLKLNEKKYSIKNGSYVRYTNDGFKDVVFMKNSASFTEQFDGKNVQHSIQFNIRFDDYKCSWHYNLLEFLDNKYAAIIETSCGKYLLTGFHFGLLPTFSVNANSDKESDYIQIQLSDVHDNGNLVGYEHEINIAYDGSSSYIYTTEHNGYECVGLGVARFLLKKEVDSFGNPTGNYKCLEGYSSQFSDLNIVGTFSETEEFESSQCGSEACRLQTSLPSSIVFYGVGSKTYTLKVGSDWTLTSSSNHITVDPSEGYMNTEYTITVTNTLEASETPVSSTLVLSCCDTLHTISVSVEESKSCFSISDVVDITATEQYVTVPTLCCVQSVSDSSNTITSLSIQQSYFKFYVPQNGTSARTIVLSVTFCDGDVGTLTINQGACYERWVFEGRACYGKRMCDIERKYTGTTSSSINTRTDITRRTNCFQTNLCGSVLTRWVDTLETTCVDGRKYIVQVEQDSYDGGSTWSDTANKRVGAETEDSPAECSAVTYEYQWVLTNLTTCIGYDKYYQYKQQQREVGTSTWEDVAPTVLSYNGNGSETPQLAEANSTDCGYVQPPQYKWILMDSSQYICDDCDGYSYRWHTDSTYCDGTAQYAHQVRQVSNDGGSTWSDVTPSETQDIVLDYYSEDCNN